MDDVDMLSMTNMTEVSNKKIIGIVGTQGAGKDTVANFLVEKFGFQHFSLSDIVRDETETRGLEHTRDNWRKTADSLRNKFGNDVFAIKMVKKIKNVDAKGFIITSFRHPGEVSVIRTACPDFQLISVDAPIELRYERIVQRGKIADSVSLEEFKAQEEAENVSGDVGMRIRETMVLADTKVINTTGFDGLKKQLNNI